ncbi:MAG: hypothetical protein B7Z06_04530 [Flavobacteriales bacterium 32-35-8]|nr:MAG: hypothetical protein B7Z06_04530 [Flavobacteriales bacterium 32-35-8]
MNTARIIIAIGFMFFSFVAEAQQKYEREYRIKSEIVPQSAKEFIDSISSDSKIKWYKEISLNDITIEAKFKHDKKKFSVEFDTLGKLQDVEFVIKKREIIPEVYNQMERKLDSLFHKWKFRKIQKHYSGKSIDVVTSIRENEPSDSIKVSYEIVLKGKKIQYTQLYEITFNEQGEMENILEIIQDKADHLEY